MPVLVYNSLGGDDRKLCQQFREPAWNYPVARFVRADRSDLIPRIDKVNRWTLAALADGMIRALEVAKRDVPVWLKHLKEADLQAEPSDALLATSLKHVPMTGRQVQAVNEWLAAGDKADPAALTGLLSARQRRIREMAEEYAKADWPVVLGPAAAQVGGNPLADGYRKATATARLVLADPDTYRSQPTPDADSGNGSSGSPDTADAKYPKDSAGFAAFAELLAVIVPKGHRANSADSVTAAIGALSGRDRKRMTQLIGHHLRGENDADRDQLLREFRRMLDD